MRVLMTICPMCGAVRRHGEWVHLTDMEMQEVHRQVQEKGLLVTPNYAVCTKCARKPFMVVIPDIPV